MTKERDMPSSPKKSSVESAEYIYDLFSKEKWSDIKSFYEENHFDAFLPLNHLGDTALHLAVYSQDTALVKSLLNIVYTVLPDFVSLYRSADSAFVGFPLANASGNTPLQEAALGSVSDSDTHSAGFKFFLANASGNTPRQEAASIGSVSDSDTHSAGLKFSLANAFGNTPLHEAASIGNIELVKLILKYDVMLLNTKNINGETPFFVAALYGQTKLIKYLLENLEEHVGYHFNSATSTMIHEAIRGYYFEIALELVDRKYCLPTDLVDRDGTCLQLLADIPSAFESGYSFGILEKLIYHGLPVPEYKDKSENNNVSPVNPSRKTDKKHGYIRSLRETKKKHSIVVKLTKILAEDDTSWRGHNTADGQRDIPLIAAAKNGITEIVKAILDVFPEAIEHQNHKKENVFHVAAQNHRENVLDLLESNKFNYPRLIEKFNAEGESILHKAAYRTDISSRERPGEALCLQSDIQWFERVKNMVPAHHENCQNKNGYTPQSLFTKEHKELVKKGQEWLIRTTNSCIIVAVLIATVAFTSIYTVPGGSDAKTGKPLLLNTTAFTVFTASDVASLCFAFTSVVVFLSITTSKMNERGFRMSLPLKLVLGLSMLFFSVAALMIGFAATLVMTIRHRLHQAAAPIIAISCFPVAIFIFLQLRLYTNITLFTIKDLLRSLIDIIPKKCQPRSWTRSS